MVLDHDGETLRRHLQLQGEALLLLHKLAPLLRLLLDLVDCMVAFDQHLLQLACESRLPSSHVSQLGVHWTRLEVTTVTRLQRLKLSLEAICLRPLLHQPLVLGYANHPATLLLTGFALCAASAFSQTR